MKACEHCVYFQMSIMGAGNGPDPKAGQGRCTRFPPSSFPVGQDNQGQLVTMTTWPAVQRSDACGEFREDGKVVGN